jgi:shikimate kinase
MKQDSRNVFLVGLMGAGKTTVGRVLARRLNLPFVDSDHEIEARTGVSIPTIFEIEGEEGFRRREAQVIEDLTQREALVLATGGGVVLDPANRALLKSGGWVVYINVPPETLYERIRHDRNRPLIQVENPLARLRELYAQRDPLYRAVADLVIDGRRLNTQGVMQWLLKEIDKRCKH